MPNKKVEVIDENSAVELVNEHYKKLSRTNYEKYSYDLNSIIDSKFKAKYKSINGIVKSFYMGIRKIADYSVLKKILLTRFFPISDVYCILNNKYIRKANYKRYRLYDS